MEFVIKNSFKLDSNIESGIYSFYNELIKSGERQLEIDIDGLPNQYMLYREFFISKINYKNINEYVNEILEYTRETYLKDSDSFEKLIVIANKNMISALDYYWLIMNKRNRYIIEKKMILTLAKPQILNWK